MPAMQFIRFLIGLALAGIFNSAYAQSYSPQTRSCGWYQTSQSAQMHQCKTTASEGAPSGWIIKHEKNAPHSEPEVFLPYWTGYYCKSEDKFNVANMLCEPKPPCPPGAELVNGKCEYGTCKNGAISGIEFKIGWARFFEDVDSGKIRLKDGSGSVTPIPPQAEMPLDVCYMGCWHYYEGNERYWVDSNEIADGIVPRFGSADYKSADMKCTEPLDTDLAGDPPENPGDDEPGDGDPDEDEPDKPGQEDNPGGGKGPGEDHGPNNPDGDGGDPGDNPDNKPGGGNNQNPAEAQCGVAGKPACTSKIDEAGTPSGPGDKMDTGKLGTEFDKLRNQLDRIADKSTKDTSWGVFPSWFRTGGCSPLNLGGYGNVTFSIDHCPAVPYAQGAASFMWLVITFFAVTGMVSRTLGAGARS